MGADASSCERADVVVVGGGHNGLICAAYLARAGLDVLVLEKNDRCGGALFSTMSGGFTLEHGAIDHSTIVGSTIPDELELGRYGLDYVQRTNSALHLFGDGVQIGIAETAEETAASIAAIDAADAESWLRLVDLSRRLFAFMTELSTGRAVPSDVAVRVGSIALGRRGRSVIDLATVSAVELAHRWFRSPHVRALAVFRSQVSGLPPWYPGTGAVFCLTPGGHGRRFARPRGGSRSFVAALESAVVGWGGRVRHQFDVFGIHRQGDGWQIESSGGGRVVAARALVSAIPPQDMVLRVLDAGAVPVPLRRRFEGIEVISGNLSQFSIAAGLARAPDVDRLASGYEPSQLWMLQHPGSVLESPAAAFAGTIPDRPGVLATFPSMADPSAAPSGAATLWINGFITHRLADAGGWQGAAVEATERIWTTVGSCLPGIRELVTQSMFVSPDDLTRRTGAVNAGLHVSATLAQLLGGRPVKGSANHRSGIDGVYLTGAGTNPGPGISGLPGRACAQAVLADLAMRQKRRNRVRLSTAGSEWARLRRVSRLALDARRGS